MSKIRGRFVSKAIQPKVSHVWQNKRYANDIFDISLISWIIYLTIFLLNPKSIHQSLGYKWAHRTCDRTANDSGLAWDWDIPSGALLFFVQTKSWDTKAWASTGHIRPAMGQLQTWEGLGLRLPMGHFASPCPDPKSKTKAKNLVLIPGVWHLQLLCDCNFSKGRSPIERNFKPPNHEGDQP